MARGDEVLNASFVDAIIPSIRVSGSVSSGGVPKQLTETQDLSTGILDFTTSETSDFIINGIYFVFSSTTTQTITLTYNGTILDEREVTPNTSVFIDLGGQKIFAILGKQLNIQCTNTGTPSITVNLIVDIELI